MIYLLVKLGQNKHLVIQILMRLLAKQATDRISKIQDRKTFITVSSQDEIQKDCNDEKLSANGS